MAANRKCGIAACMSLIGEKRTWRRQKRRIEGANNKLRTHLALFFCEIFWKRFSIFSGKIPGRRKKFPRHPHFIGGRPAVCTGPSPEIARNALESRVNKSGIHRPRFFPYSSQIESRHRARNTIADSPQRLSNSI